MPHWKCQNLQCVTVITPLKHFIHINISGSLYSTKLPQNLGDANGSNVCSTPKGVLTTLTLVFTQSTCHTRKPRAFALLLAFVPSRLIIALCFCFAFSCVDYLSKKMGLVELLYIVEHRNPVTLLPLFLQHLLSAIT